MCKQSGDEQSRADGGRWSGQGMNCLEMNSPGQMVWAGYELSGDEQSRADGLGRV